MSFAIRVDQISKRFRVPQSSERVPYRTLREDLERMIASSWKRWRNGAERRAAEEFWALRDIAFEVRHGELLGIVGCNGAGKSTLLKILGRVTRPTAGSVRIRGRLGMLLEVGTGFHHELTGRENIFLAGAILGMRRNEIRRKFDAIVDFAEIESFLDTPVKRYSSGMYMRLGFSVAAHLDPEILLIDEVLAVGDIAFQRKCLSKMGNLAGENRTVLFVSHNMSAIRQLCPRSLLLDRGRLVHDGPTQETLRIYHDSLRTGKVDEETGSSRRLERGNGAVRFTNLSIQNVQGEPEWDFRTGETIRIQFSYRAAEAAPDLRFYFALQSASHREVITTVSRLLSEKPVAEGATGSYVLELPEISLRPGEYFPYVWLGSVMGASYDVLDWHSVSFPPLTIWSNETDPHKVAGFFSIPARLEPVEPPAPQS